MTQTRTATQRQRDKIRSGKILERLIAHVRGEIELSNSQVNAAKALMAKILPDLKGVELKTLAINRPVSKMSDAELQEIIRAGLERERAERLAEGAALKVVPGRSNKRS